MKNKSLTFNKSGATSNQLFWLLTILVGIITVISGLVRDGMFMDGTQYACVSKNMAQGLGSFWHPYLSDTWWKAGSQEFMEHPPLGYYLQSLFFRIFGSSFIVERIYLFIIFLFTVWGIIKCWNLTQSTSEQKSLQWLPVILFLIVPIASWSIKNNLLEVTMGMFNVYSIYFLIKSIVNRKSWLKNILLGSMFLFCSTMVKGVPGLFPLVFFIIYWAVNKELKLVQALKLSGFVLFFMFLFYSLLLINDDAQAFYKFYIFDRLLYRIDNEPVVGNRLWSLQRLFFELIPLILLCFIASFLGRKEHHVSTVLRKYRSSFLLFFIIGLSASVPLLLTPVQRGFYLYPSMPYFAIAFALFLEPYVENLINKNWFNSSLGYISMFVKVLIVIFLVYSFINFHKPSRDKEKLADVYRISELVEPFTLIEVPRNVYDDWSFQFYLLRYNNCYLKVTDDFTADFIILNKKTIENNQYQLMDQQFNQYFLFKKGIK